VATTIGAGAASAAPSSCRWAASVVGFSSQYDPISWSAQQALGPPDTYPGYGDISSAWASLTADVQREYLVLAFDDPGPINFVTVYETWNPGALDTILVKNPSSGSFEVVWTRAAAPAPEVSRVFTATFPMTPFPVSEVRLAIDSPAVPSWNEIDAVSIGLCDLAAESQWASGVLDFSSQWDPVYWSAQQALGPPDTYPGYGDISTSWASRTANDQREFLVLQYANPSVINFVSLYETWYPGALDTVKVKNPATGEFEVVWSGAAAPAPGTSRIFTVSFPVTRFPVSEVRLDFDSPAVAGFNEIDAAGVGLCACSQALVDVPATGGKPGQDLLAAPRPNPFTGSTEIGFTLAREERVKIEVFNALGQRVTRLADQVMPAGRHAVSWNGRDEGGRAASSGIYYVMLEAGSSRSTKKVVKLE
jgi:hypothetical protein